MAPREDEDEKVCRLSLRETQLQVVNIGAKVVNIGAKVDLLSAQLVENDDIAAPPPHAEYPPQVCRCAQY